MNYAQSDFAKQYHIPNHYGTNNDGGKNYLTNTCPEATSVEDDLIIKRMRNIARYRLLTKTQPQEINKLTFEPSYSFTEPNDTINTVEMNSYINWPLTIGLLTVTGGSVGFCLWKRNRRKANWNDSIDYYTTDSDDVTIDTDHTELTYDAHAYINYQ